MIGIVWPGRIDVAARAATLVAHWRVESALLLAALRPRAIALPFGPSRLAAATALAAVSIGSLLAHLQLGAPIVVAAYLAFDRATRAIEVVDATGRWSGVVPAAMLPSTRVCSAWPRHLSAYLETVPQAWTDVLLALEDRHLDGWQSWRGLDLAAIARSALLAPLGGTRGGSSLVMQLVRSMRHFRPMPTARSWTHSSRVATARCSTRLSGAGRHPLPAAARSAYAAGAGHTGSRLGGSIYGVGLASRSVFGKAAEALGVAEQAILAAAARRPVLLSGRPKIGRDRRPRRPLG